MANKIDRFDCDCTLKFDVILLSEIGRSDVSHLSSVLADYDLEFVPSSSRCGGVGIFYRTFFSKQYVKKQVIASNMSCSCPHCQVEDIWLGLRIDNNLCCISACYRQPRGNVKHFLESLEDTLNSSFIPHMCVIGGDFNINLLNADSNAICEDYTKLMLCHNFIPTITLPTRISHSSTTLIDNIFVRLLNKLLDNKLFSGNFFTDLSDHLPSFCIIEGFRNTKLDRPFIRFYSQHNFDNFIQSLESLDMSSIYNNSDVNIAYSNLIEIVQSQHNIHFPLVRMSRKKFNDKPWITPGIMQSISTKNVLYRKYVKKPTAVLKAKLSSYRRILQRTIRSAQSTYYKNRIYRLVKKSGKFCSAQYNQKFPIKNTGVNNT